MLRYRIMADAVVAAHAAFVGFVVFGMVAIVVGLVLRRSWARNFWFRILHLATIGFVVALTWTGLECPLTTLEKDLRQRAGEASYPGGFIAHYLHKLIFYDAPSWVFTLSYSVFGLVVLAVFVLGPPRWKRGRPIE